MFSFFKKKEGPVGPVLDLDGDVQLLSLEESTVIFRSQVEYPMHKPVEVTAMVPTGNGGAQKCRAQMLMLQVCPLEKVREYVGLLSEVTPPALKAHISSIISQSVKESSNAQEQRATQRFVRSFQVMSPRFPGFKAMSYDISLDGMNVMVDAPIPVGETIPLRLNFDDDNFAPVETRADIKWCQGREGKFSVGVRFIGLTPAQRQIIESYLQWVEWYTEHYKQRMV